MLGLGNMRPVRRADALGRCCGPMLQAFLQSQKRVGASQKITYRPKRHNQAGQHCHTQWIR